MQREWAAGGRDGAARDQSEEGAGCGRMSGGRQTWTTGQHDERRWRADDDVREWRTMMSGDKRRYKGWEKEEVQ